MTLMNGLAAGDRATIWSDTLWLDPYTTKPIGYGPKSFTTQLFPGAVAFTTIGGNSNKISEMVGAQTPFHLGGLLDACEAAARAFVTVQPDIAMVRLLVAGWCYERDEARMFLITSQEGKGFAPFQAQEVGWFMHDQTHPAVKVAIAEGLTADKMREIADVQQGSPFKVDGFGTMTAIGGELVECEVTRAGAATRTVKAWALPETLAA